MQNRGQFDDRQTDRQTDSAISLIRCISMLMIVTCHFFQYYGNELAYWFNGGVYIFFAISGFLYGSKTIDDPIKFLARKFKSVLMPYYTFLVPAIALYFFFARSSFSVGSVVKALVCSGTIDGLGHLWFVAYILFCYFITPYLYWFVKKCEGYSFLRFTCISIVLLIAIQVIGYMFDSFFRADRITCYIIGYLFSVYSRRYGKKVTVGICVLFAVSGVAVNIVRIYIKYLSGMQLSGIFAKIFIFAEPYAHLLLFSAMFMVLYLIASKVKYNALLKLSDRYSYEVYLVHQLFILSPFSLMAITPIKYLNWVLVVVAIVLLAVILKFVTEKIIKPKKVK